jgi:PAS domain S-box-containing protein
MNEFSADSAERDHLMRLHASIVEATSDAMVVLDSSIKIRYCNAAAERLYGVRLSDVVGKEVTAMHGYAWIHKDDEQRCLSDLARHGSWTGEYIHILNSGSQLVVQSTVNILDPAAGGGMVAVIRDVTERKRSELKSQQQLAALTRANEDLLHFAYAVSHDLQAPLRTVISFVQLLSAKYKEHFAGQAGDFLRFIVEAASHMSLMLGGLLRFAEAAGEKADFTKQVFLEHALSIAIASLNSAIEESHAVVTHGGLPTVFADSGQMVSLLQNLIGNSIKYRKPDTPPRVHISAVRSGKGWHVTVRDNGIGFDSKDSERIFGVFKRLHGKEFAGTGIGLTICRRFVEQRGGRIWAEGKPGDGAALHFTIPDPPEQIEAAPPMPWDEMRCYLDKRSFHPSRIGEVSKALDLAQAIVREFDGTIVFWTQGAERLFGFADTEALGKQLHVLLHSELPSSREAVESALMQDGEWKGEMKAYKRDNTILWLVVHKVLYRDGNGQPKSVVEVFNDITALKRVEDALVHSIEQRDLALNAAQLGIWRWDSRTGVVEWSPILESILGMAPGSFEGTFEAFKERLHPDDRQALHEQIEKAFNSGTEYAIENRLRHTNGQYVWVRGQGRAILDEEKRGVGLVGVVWDISERKHRDNDDHVKASLADQPPFNYRPDDDLPEQSFGSVLI